MKRIILMVVSLSLISSMAFAFGMPSLPSSNSGSSSNLSADQLKDKLGSVGKDYFGASKNFMLSMVSAQNAFGFKKDAETLKSEANQLGTGVLDSAMADKTSNLLTSASGKIAEKIKSGVKLDEQGKKNLSDSMVFMGKGIVQEVPLVATITSLTKSTTDSLKSAPITQLASIKTTASTLATLGSNVPKDLLLAKNTLGLYIDYAKANGVEIPKDASDVFK